MKQHTLAWSGLLAGLLALGAGYVYAIDSETQPRPVPLTRPEMKRFLEDMKQRKPRIPLPELTDEDRENLGDRAADSYESRLRYHYMSSRDGQSERRGGGNRSADGQRRGGGGGGFGFGRNSDPDMSLDYAFKTQLFWIVSRANNCQYCLGHQESKLLAAGMTEDEIAALDSDWSQFPEKSQAAYAFTRRITNEPHLLSDDDIDELKKHFTDKQILEMVLSIAGNNSINRWKEGAGIPQSSNGGSFGSRGPNGERLETAETRQREEHSYLTPTSEKFQLALTKVAPVRGPVQDGETSAETVCERPPLESPAEVEKTLQAAAERKSRLPLVDDADARALLPERFPEGDLPRWVTLLANFSGSAGRISSILNAEQRGDLSPLLKAQVSWIIARQDRAWYATAEAKRRLKDLGWSDEQIYQLDGSWEKFSPSERAMFTLAQKLAASPVVLTDADVDEAVKQAGPRDVVQLISYTTHRASFNRITEAAGLPADR